MCLLQKLLNNKKTKRFIALMLALFLLLPMLLLLPIYNRRKAGKDMTVNAAEGTDPYRAYLEYTLPRNTTSDGYYTAGILRQTIMYVYARAGETICLGSDVCDSIIAVDDDGNETISPNSANCADIVVIQPNGTVVRLDSKYDGIGCISTVEQEELGPNYIGSENTGGYTPHEFVAPEEGIYEIRFHSFSGDRTIGGIDDKNTNYDQNHRYSFYYKNYSYKETGTSPETGEPTTEAKETGSGSRPDPLSVKKSENNWKNTGATVGAWDITVVDKNEKDANQRIKRGRAYTKCLCLNVGNNTATTSATYNIYINEDFYVVTTDGYIYNTRFDQIDPFGFVFFSNNRGLIDVNTNNSTYHSYQTSTTNLSKLFSEQNVTFQNPMNKDTDTDKTFRIFFEKPDPELTSILYPKAYVPDEVTDIEFIGSKHDNVSYVKDGGYFKFSVSKSTSATVIVSFDEYNAEHGTNYTPVSITENAFAGENYFYWNGCDGSGTVIPKGVYDSGIEVSVRNHAGEYHFPLFDVENSPGRIYVERINRIYERCETPEGEVYDRDVTDSYEDQRYNIYYNNSLTPEDAVYSRCQLIADNDYIKQVEKYSIKVNTITLSKFKANEPKFVTGVNNTDTYTIRFFNREATKEHSPDLTDEQLEEMFQNALNGIEDSRAYYDFYFVIADQLDCSDGINSHDEEALHFIGRSGDLTAIDIWTYSFGRPTMTTIKSSIIIEELNDYRHAAIRGKVFYDNDNSGDYSIREGDYGIAGVRVTGDYTYTEQRWEAVYDEENDFIGLMYNDYAGDVLAHSYFLSPNISDEFFTLYIDGDMYTDDEGNAIPIPVTTKYLSIGSTDDPGTEDLTEPPTEEPTEAPTVEPTEETTEPQTAEPTAEQGAEPTEPQVAEPTGEPAEDPTEAPTAAPTEAPTAAPTDEPSHPEPEVILRYFADIPIHLEAYTDINGFYTFTGILMLENSEDLGDFEINIYKPYDYYNITTERSRSGDFRDYGKENQVISLDKLYSMEEQDPEKHLFDAADVGYYYEVYEPPIVLKKDWVTDVTSDPDRPYNISFHLVGYGDGVKYYEEDVMIYYFNNSWSKSLEHLPRKVNGVEINYVVEYEEFYKNGNYYKFDGNSYTDENGNVTFAPYSSSILEPELNFTGHVLAVKNEPLTKSIEITKRANDDRSVLVAGAVFTLEKYSEETDEWEVLTEGATTNALGILSFNNVENGRYRITETDSPEIYGLAEPFEVEVTDEKQVYKQVVYEPLSQVRLTLKKNFYQYLLSGIKETVFFPGQKFKFKVEMAHDKDFTELLETSYSVEYTPEAFVSTKVLLDRAAIPNCSDGCDVYIRITEENAGSFDTSVAVSASSESLGKYNYTSADYSFDKNTRTLVFKTKPQSENGSYSDYIVDFTNKAEYIDTMIYEKKWIQNISSEKYGITDDYYAVYAKLMRKNEDTGVIEQVTKSVSGYNNANATNKGEIVGIGERYSTNINDADYAAKGYFVMKGKEWTKKFSKESYWFFPKYAPDGGKYTYFIQEVTNDNGNPLVLKKGKKEPEFDFDYKVMPSDAYDEVFTVNNKNQITKSTIYYDGKDIFSKSGLTLSNEYQGNYYILNRYAPDLTLQVTKTELSKTNAPDEPKIPLKGAGFTLYEDEECTIPIEEIITDQNGKAKFTHQLELNKTYYMKETRAPSGYVIDTDKIKLEYVEYKQVTLTEPQIDGTNITRDYYAGADYTINISRTNVLVLETPSTGVWFTALNASTVGICIMSTAVLAAIIYFLKLERSGKGKKDKKLK